MAANHTPAAQQTSPIARLLAAIERSRVYRDVWEIGLVAVAFLLYFIVRGLVVDRADEAMANANDIIDLERSLGIFWEPRLQELIIDNRALVQLMNAIYFWLDFPLIVAVGLFLYFRRRHEYTVARDALLLSGAISLVIYNLYPVMPPRLLPGGEFIGTIEEYSDLSYQASSTAAFVNPYAAVPSLHFGWAVIIGGTVFLTFRNPLARLIGLLLPWAQLAAIVFTANHYIFDAFVGLVVCLVGTALAWWMQRRVYPWVQREVDRRWRGGEPRTSPITRMESG
jgi:hypothetical protein